MRRKRVSDRVRQRLRDEADVRKIGQRELADLATKRDDENWSQSRVGKILSGVVRLTVDDLDVLARALGITLVEAVRDRGLEFFAEMTPTEVRILEQLRRRPRLLHGVMMILDLHTDAEPDVPVVKRPKRGRPLNSELAKQRT